MLWALDGRLAWTGLLRAMAADFGNDPHFIVRWADTASPRDFGSLAPRVFDYAARGDAVAVEMAEIAARHIDALAVRLVEVGATRLAMVGGCAPFLQNLLAETTKSHLVEPIRRCLGRRLASCALGRAIAGARGVMVGGKPRRNRKSFDMRVSARGMAAELREAPAAVRRQADSLPGRSPNSPLGLPVGPRMSLSPVQGAAPRMRRPLPSI